MAGLGPKEINVATVHDCFTIAEIVAYEDLGFCEKGEGGKLIQARETYVGGKIPVNVDGGLKSKGHPLGATGVSMAIDYNSMFQIRGKCVAITGGAGVLIFNSTITATHAKGRPAEAIRSCQRG